MGTNTVQATGAKGRKDALAFDPSDIVLITDKAHPLYDERVHLPVDRAMVESIKAVGVLEPILVRRNGEQIECVVGRQRVKAARQANLELSAEGKPTVDIYAILRRGDDADMLEVIISENEQRTGVDPMNRARNMQRLANFGRDEARIGVVFGRSLQSVKMTLQLLDLDETVQQAVSAGTIGSTFAVQELAPLAREEQAARLSELVANGTTKGTEAREAIRDLKAGRPVRPKKIGAPRAKMRSRLFLVRLLAVLQEDGFTEAAALLGWALGDDEALGKRGAGALRKAVAKVEGEG